MRSGDGLVVLGRFCGAHGVRGALKVYSHTDPPQSICGYRPWLVKIGHSWQSVDFEPLVLASRSIRVRLPGVDDRDQADQWCGREISVRRSSLPATSEQQGEFYWHDLIGLEVFARGSGERLGKVCGLMETAGHDVLRVQGEREYLLPWDYGNTIAAVDLEAGRMTVVWREPV